MPRKLSRKLHRRNWDCRRRGGTYGLARRKWDCRRRGGTHDLGEDNSSASLDVAYRVQASVVNNHIQGWLAATVLHHEGGPSVGVLYRASKHCEHVLRARIVAVAFIACLDGFKVSRTCHN